MCLNDISMKILRLGRVGRRGRERKVEERDAVLGLLRLALCPPMMFPVFDILELWFVKKMVGRICVG